MKTRQQRRAEARKPAAQEAPKQLTESTPIILHLTVGEANLIQQALVTRPFMEVAPLILKIKEQGEAQVASMQPPAPKGIDPQEVKQKIGEG